jgi:hypothetical protein
MQQQMTGGGGALPEVNQANWCSAISKDKPAASAISSRLQLQHIWYLHQREPPCCNAMLRPERMLQPL